MRITNLITVIGLMLTSGLSWSATSCIQTKASGTYASPNKHVDCLIPGASVRSTSVLPQVTEQENNVAVHASNFEEKSGSISSLISSEALPATTWNLRVEDGSVYVAIKRWSAIAGWQVSWEIPVDYPIEIIDSSTGSFESSVRRVLAAFAVSDYPPYPCFHENHVVRIVRRIQGNDSECKWSEASGLAYSWQRIDDVLIKTIWPFKWTSLRFNCLQFCLVWSPHFIFTFNITFN